MVSGGFSDRALVAIVMHESPVCVLDFASLYPSLIIGYNMSYDTLLSSAAANSQHAPPHEVVHLNSGGRRDFGYVTADTHKGVVPEVLENLLAERKEVKQLLKNERDDDMRTILDLRQKAIKVAANAFCKSSQSTSGLHLHTTKMRASSTYPLAKVVYLLQAVRR